MSSNRYRLPKVNRRLLIATWLFCAVLAAPFAVGAATFDASPPPSPSIGVEPSAQPSAEATPGAEATSGAEATPGDAQPTVTPTESPELPPTDAPASPDPSSAPGST